MKPCTKFIIALWIFFLLSLVVHAQRGVQTNKIQTGGGGEISRAELTDSVSTRTTYKDVNDSLNLVRQQYQDSLNNRVIEQRFLDSLNAVRGDIPIVSETNPFLQQTGFVWGNLDANLSYTEAQKKTIRRQNYLYFETIIGTAKATNTCLDFPGNTLQLHLLPADEILISDKQIVCLTGVDKKSKLEFFPKALIRGNISYVFKVGDGGSIDFRNIYFLGSNNFTRAEVYSGELRLNGDYTKIKIQDTVQIRAGFWNSSLNGAKVGIKHSSTNTVARTYTIDSFDSTSRVITLSGAGIDFTVDTAFADAGTLLAFHWNTDEIHTDTVSRYSQFFRLEETSSYHVLIYGTIGEANFSKQAYIKLKNCRIEQFQTGIYVSGGWLDYHFEDSYFQGDEIAITKYVGSSGYGNPSTIHMNRCELAYSGKELVANAVQPYGTQNGNLLFGSGAYNHPNTRVVVKDCYIHDNLTGAFRQFSDGPEKPSPEWYTSYFINCTFKDNAEYHLLASNTHKTVIQNCTFDNGKVYLAYSTDMDNTSLLNSYVNLYGYGNAQPKPDSDTVQLRVNFNRVKFYKYSTFANGWSNSRSKRTVISFNNCDFELGANTTYYNQKINTGNYCRVNIDNANIFSRFKGDYPDVVNKTKGTQLQGFLYYGHDVKLYGNNINYDTLRNSIPIIPTNRQNYISGKISNSRLLGIEGQFSQTGSNYGLVLENVEYPYVYYNATYAYNFKSGVDKIATVSIGTNNIYGTSYANSIWTTSSANTYFISNSDSLKYVFWGANSITTQASLQKRPWTGFSGAIRIVADTSFCIASGGNIRVSSPVCYNEGDVIELKYFPFVPNNETKTIVRDSILANGTTVNFNNGGIDASIKSYKPGLCKIYIDNSLVGTDNMNERVVGTTVSGYVGYLSDRFNIFFTTPPTNGSYVIIERVSVSQGIWKIID